MRVVKVHSDLGQVYGAVQPIQGSVKPLLDVVECEISVFLCRVETAGGSSTYAFLAATAGLTPVLTQVLPCFFRVSGCW